MSTTPQRYDVVKNARDLTCANKGRYILFTDHEADKARAVADIRYELSEYKGMVKSVSASQQFQKDRADAAESTIATQQATIAELTAQRDEAFKLSKCQCGTDEACRNLYQKQATIARLTKAVERASELLEAVRTGEDFEAVCWEAAEEFKQMLKNPSP